MPLRFEARAANVQRAAMQHETIQLTYYLKQAQRQLGQNLFICNIRPAPRYASEFRRLHIESSFAESTLFCPQSKSPPLCSAIILSLIFPQPEPNTFLVPRGNFRNHSRTRIMITVRVILLP